MFCGARERRRLARGAIRASASDIKSERERWFCDGLSSCLELLGPATSTWRSVLVAMKAALDSPRLALRWALRTRCRLLCIGEIIAEILALVAASPRSTRYFAERDC